MRPLVLKRAKSPIERRDTAAPVSYRHLMPRVAPRDEQISINARAEEYELGAFDDLFALMLADITA